MKSQSRAHAARKSRADSATARGSDALFDAGETSPGDAHGELLNGAELDAALFREEVGELRIKMVLDDFALLDESAYGAVDEWDVGVEGAVDAEALFDELFELNTNPNVLDDDLEAEDADDEDGDEEDVDESSYAEDEDEEEADDDDDDDEYSDAEEKSSSPKRRREEESDDKTHENNADSVKPSWGKNASGQDVVYVGKNTYREGVDAVCAYNCYGQKVLVKVKNSGARWTFAPGVENALRRFFLIQITRKGKPYCKADDEESVDLLQRHALEDRQLKNWFANHRKRSKWPSVARLEKEPAENAAPLAREMYNALMCYKENHQVEKGPAAKGAGQPKKKRVKRGAC